MFLFIMSDNKSDVKIKVPEIPQCQHYCGFKKCSNQAIEEINLKSCFCREVGSRWLCKDCITTGIKDGHIKIG